MIISDDMNKMDNNLRQANSTSAHECEILGNNIIAILDFHVS